LKRDKKKRYRFASLQSEYAIKILNLNLIAKEPNTIILQKNETFYFESDAVLEICKHLRGLWPLLYVFKVIPNSLRDKLYKFIADNRYKWFGKKDKCYLPGEEIKNRFIV